MNGDLLVYRGVSFRTSFHCLSMSIFSFKASLKRPYRDAN